MDDRRRVVFRVHGGLRQMLLRPWLGPDQIFAAVVGLLSGLSAAFAYLQVVALSRFYDGRRLARAGRSPIDSHFSLLCLLRLRALEFRPCSPP